MAAVATGLVDQSSAPDTPDVQNTISLHITAGIALLIAVGLSLYWPVRNKKLWSAGAGRWGYLALLLVVVGLVAVEGYLGGKLVYTYGVGVR
jgi:uncharacterized membrane protein